MRIPLFDSTCDVDPRPNGSEKEACPDENVGGHGQNQWYHLADVGFFQFCPGDPTSSADNGFAARCAAEGIAHGPYVNGNNKAVCDTGNGATSCLVGRFVNYLINAPAGGTLSTVPGPSKAVSVQLIK